MKNHNTAFRLIFLLSILLLTSCSRNFSKLVKTENNYRLTTEMDLKDSTNSQKIQEFYDSGIEGTFGGKAGVDIYYRIFEVPGANKAILLSAGRTEAAVKYKEVIFDLYRNGYSVYIHDHRGQGQSGRMTEDPEMGYIDDFQFYIDDMKYFYDQYIATENYVKTYLLAHSMGGAIGMTYLEQYPADFNAAAFSSPMLGLKPGTCGATKLFGGKRTKYALGQSGYKDDKSKFKKNTLTGSRVRYDRMIDAFEKVPEARLGGATYQWVNRSCDQFKYIFYNIDKINTPFILFSAEKEKIVYPYAHQKFMKAAEELGKECIAYEVEDAKHELLIETDELRSGTINKALDFYANY